MTARTGGIRYVAPAAKDRSTAKVTVDDADKRTHKWLQQMLVVFLSTGHKWAQSRGSI